MRGISIWFIAARTKLAPERIAGIEDGSAPLSRDGHGRATARLLVGAIGADPEEGVVRLSGGRLKGSRRQPVHWRQRFRGVATPVLLVLALLTVAGGVLLLARWLEMNGVDGDAPSPVQRKDYIERLLGGDGS